MKMFAADDKISFFTYSGDIAHSKNIYDSSSTINGFQKENSEKYLEWREIEIYRN